jgi:hypothetical protein
MHCQQVTGLRAKNKTNNTVQVRESWQLAQEVGLDIEKCKFKPVGSDRGEEIKGMAKTKI